jgi:hypothetical protein
VVSRRAFIHLPWQGRPAPFAELGRTNGRGPHPKVAPPTACSGRVLRFESSIPRYGPQQRCRDRPGERYRRCQARIPNARSRIAACDIRELQIGSRLHLRQECDRHISQATGVPCGTIRLFKLARSAGLFNCCGRTSRRSAGSKTAPLGLGKHSGRPPMFNGRPCASA